MEKALRFTLLFAVILLGLSNFFIVNILCAASKNEAVARVYRFQDAEQQRSYQFVFLQSADERSGDVLYCHDSLKKFSNLSSYIQSACKSLNESIGSKSLSQHQALVLKKKLLGFSYGTVSVTGQMQLLLNIDLGDPAMMAVTGTNIEAQNGFPKISTVRSTFEKIAEENVMTARELHPFVRVN